MSALYPNLNNCTNRVKPTLLRDIKTEAILVFSRTALERYFEKLDHSGFQLKLGTQEETDYVYDTLKQLLFHLQKHVVNADYLIDVFQGAQQESLLKLVAQKEESLMSYYNVMAQKVRDHYKGQTANLPELLVVCVLAQWILEEEKSTHFYPFLNDFDFLELMAKFEINRQYFEYHGKCIVSDLLELSYKVVEKLKDYKYKVNNNRVSKSRKKSKRR